MTIDIQAKKASLKRLKLAAFIAWAATVLLFIVPVIQWRLYGKVPFDRTFILITAFNLLTLVISARISSRLRFIKYQISYFSTHGDQQ